MTADDTDDFAAGVVAEKQTEVLARLGDREGFYTAREGARCAARQNEKNEVPPQTGSERPGRRVPRRSLAQTEPFGPIRPKPQSQTSSLL